MSKHSHWAKIKHGKGSTDVKRGMMFTKLSRAITIAAKQKGGDPNFNFSLRLAIDQAKAANVPKDNIERAIVKATGGDDGATLEELLYEGFLPGGIGVLIAATSDNKNRTAQEVKTILSKHEGSLASTGAVKWNFTRLGVIELAKEQVLLPDALALKAIDLGAEDIKLEDENMIIYTKPELLEAVKTGLEKDEIKIVYAGLGWIPKERISLDPATREKVEAALEELEESEEVDDYYTNLA